LSDRPTLADLIEVRRQFKLPHEALVEKDWHVVRALAAITAADKGPFQLVFQGGTALSRAHRLIERMSEDIDIKIRPPDLTDFSMTPNRRLSAVRCQETDFRCC
jgi:predicted nucleotidyltransferase component of viral defense system